MTKNKPQKREKKRAGRKPGIKIKHGAYSLIARGHLPENRRYLRAYLTQCREGLISDLGPTEGDLSTAQKILIDRVIGKLGVLRCLEEYAREQGVIREGKLFSPLEHNFLAWSNSLRLDLQALGIDKRVGEKILSPLEIAAEIDAAKAKEDAQRVEDGASSAGVERKEDQIHDDGQGDNAAGGQGSIEKTGGIEAPEQSWRDNEDKQGKGGKP